MRKIALFLLIVVTLSGCVSGEMAREYDQRHRSNFEPGDQKISQRRERLDREEARIKEEREQLAREEQVIARMEEPFREIRSPRRRSSIPSRIEAGPFEIGGDFDSSFSSMDVEVDGFESSDSDTTKLDVTLLYYVAPDVGMGFTFYAENEKETSGGESISLKTVALGPLIGTNINISDWTNLRFFGSLILADLKFTDVDGSTGKADGFGLM